MYDGRCDDDWAGHVAGSSWCADGYHKIGGLLVVENSWLVGILTETNVLNALIQLLEG
jgi:hypothetical protein